MSNWQRMAIERVIRITNRSEKKYVSCSTLVLKVRNLPPLSAVRLLVGSGPLNLFPPTTNGIYTY
jgi:hypothetical protein